MKRKSFIVLLLFFYIINGISAQNNNALFFDGINDHVKLDTLPAVSFSKGFTYTGMIRWNAFGSWSRLVDFGNGPGSDNILIANNSTTGKLSVHIYNGTVSGSFNSSVIPPLGEFVHVAVTIDSVRCIKIYLNGVLRESGSVNIPNAVSRNSCFLGKSNWNDAYFKGSMDEVSMWNRALTQHEIVTGMRNGFHRDADSLFFYYKFDQGIADNNNSGIDTLTSEINPQESVGTLVNFALSGASSNWINGCDFTAIPVILSSSVSKVYLDGTSGGSKLLIVASNDAWTISDTCDWFSLDVYSGIYSDTIVVTSTAENNSGLTLKSDITFSGGTVTMKVTVIQAQKIIAVVPTAGNGTSSDPYQITTLENLYWLMQNSDYWNKSFIQTTDIDASATYAWDDGKGFAPVGNEYRFFDGQYNGKGHIISNLYINRSLPYGTGLFGIALFATIDSVGLINCEIYGQDNVGGMVGTSDMETTISNSFVRGSVTGNNYVGALVGSNHDGMILNCYAVGNVRGQNYYAGGLIGYNSRSEIRNSYAACNVKGKSLVGGLIGSNSESSTVSNCYAIGDVSGEDYVGGLVGNNDMHSTITNCYANGKVISNSDLSIGGLAGNNYFNSTLSNCYWNTENSGQSSAIGYNEEGILNTCTGLLSDEMSHQENFAGWDFSIIWGIVEGNSYPALKSVENNAPFAYADTLLGHNKAFSLARFLVNDYDFETFQDFLAIEILSMSAGTHNADSLYVPVDINMGDTLLIEYQVGEIIKAMNDTLWGNTARSMIIVGNNKPVLITATNIAIPEDSKHLFTLNDVKSIDEDGDRLSLVLSAGENYTLHGDTLMPDKDFYGSTEVKLAVTDGFDTSAVVTTTVDVISVNDAPVVYDISATLSENDTLTLDVFAHDIDGTIRSIAIGNDPVHGSAKHTGMKITYIPDKDFTGKDSLTWFAVDNYSLLSVPAKLVVTVNLMKHAPEIHSTAPAIATQGIEYFYTVSASDINQDSLIYCLSNAPEGMIISDGGIITWTPDENATTSGDVILHVSDGELEDTETFRISVNRITSNEVIPGSGIFLYPNPCVDGFFINAGPEASILYLYDIRGQIMLTQTVRDISRVDMSHLHSGAYIVSINGATLHLIKK